MPSSSSTCRRAAVIRGLGVAAVVTLAACSLDRSTAPGAAHAGPTMSPAVVLAAPQVMTGVQWQAPLATDVTASAVIGSAGGTLALPATGFKLVVPKGAVSQPTTFSVTALAGGMVAYQFEPHGTSFPVPLQASQDLRFVDLTTVPVLSNVRVAYFPDRTMLDDADDQGTVSELAASLLDLAGSQVRFNISHFSGYMVSSGRFGDDGQQ